MLFQHEIYRLEERFKKHLYGVWKLHYAHTEKKERTY